MDKVRFTTLLDKYTMNPVFKALSALWLSFPGVVILETTGRRSGRPRRTPVGGRRDGSTVWIMAEHGRRNAYVSNIEADPRVRIRIRGRWRTGVAKLMPNDDPRERLRRMTKGTVGLKLIESVTRVEMTKPMTLQVELSD